MMLQVENFIKFITSTFRLLSQFNTQLLIMKDFCSLSSEKSRVIFCDNSNTSNTSNFLRKTNVYSKL